VPLFFPVIVGLGYDPLWFGIIIVLVVQIGLISPPVGMNIFVVQALLPDVTTRQIFRGVLPFNVALVAMLALMVAFPKIATLLPGLMR
jgi:TRAP-type C4-dicarboxylate transport system permease large subunit